MEKFLTTIPGIIMTIGAVIGVIVLGVFYIAGIYSKTKNGEDDRLINILQETVDTLEKKVDQQKKEHDETVDILGKKIDNLTRKVEHLEKENETLTKVLQGRDEKTLEYQKRGFEAMNRVEETYNIITTMAKSIQDTNTAMTKLIDLLGKNLEVIGKVASK